MQKTFVLWLFILLVISYHGKAQHFIQNKGQWPEHVQFAYNVKSAQIFILADGLRFKLIDPTLPDQMHKHNGQHKMPDGPVKSHVFDVKFNGNAESVFGLQKLRAYHNYFLGKNPKSWQGNVPLYNQVYFKNLYTDVDLKLKAGYGNIKYDIVLAPKANPKNIRWNYEGAEHLHLENNRLIIETSVGRLVEEAPIAWQIIKGKMHPVEIAFVLDGNEVSYKLGKYNTRYELIIDPNFIFSTYTGSSSDNFGFTATYDKDGNAYGGGIVYGAQYPTTTGAFDTTFINKGGFDCAISKFSPDGTQLIYSTYLGGNDLDQPHSMVVDSAGNLIVMGSTGSSSFPTTSSAFDTSFNGSGTTQVGWLNFANGVDLFVTKFNNTGSALLGSTFLGGTGADGANTASNIYHNYGDAARGEVQVNLAGEIFFAANSTSQNFPTANAVQDSLSGGQDAVIGQLSADCSQLLWSTYYGGTANDCANSLSFNTTEDKLFVTGATKSTNFPVSATAYQNTFGGNTDGYILAFDLTNKNLIQATYVGTNAYDQAFFIDVDYDDAVYIFGQTKGAYPTSNNVWSVPNSAQFLHKFNPNLQQSLRSTVFGDGSTQTIDISPTALLVDDCKSIYISGWGGQTNNEGFTNGLPTTPNAYDTATDGSDFYFLVLDGTWQTLEYATFFGGINANEHVDGGTSRFSPEGIIYQAVCAGCGGNSNFPSFPSNVYSPTNNSPNCNLACFKVHFDLQQADVNITLLPDSACAPHGLTFVDSSKNVDVMEWDFGDGTTYTGKQPNKVFTQPGKYTLKIVGTDTLCNTVDSQFVDLHIFASNTTASFLAKYDSCATPYVVNFTNQSSNASQYVWLFGDGTTSSLENPTKTYATKGPFTVKLAAKNNTCSNWDTAKATILFASGGGSMTFEIEYDACTNWQNVQFIPKGTGYYQEFTWSFGDGDTSHQRFPTHTYSQPGTYQITMVAHDTVCGKTITENQTFSVTQFDKVGELFPNVFSPNGDGINDTWQISKELSPSQFSTMRVEVYNRWGSLVYAAQHPTFTWDGKFEDKILAEGVYFWLVWYTDICGNSVEKHGEVHIMD